MSTNLEIEAKALLTREEYNKILSSLDKKSYVQINYYFDTKDLFLVSKKLGLRIREKNNTFELTLKIKQKEGKLEINQTLSKEKALEMLKSFNVPHGEIRLFLEANYKEIINQISLVATLKTTRTDFEYKDSLISIDHSEYSDKEDYEIEAESTSMKLAKENIKDFLSSFKIEYKENSQTKLSRVLDTIYHQ